MRSAAIVPECDLLFTGRIGKEQPGTCIRIVTLDALAGFVSEAAAEIARLKTVLEPAMEAEWNRVMGDQIPAGSSDDDPAA